jgi:hypothetical protein
MDSPSKSVCEYCDVAHVLPVDSPYRNADVCAEVNDRKCDTFGQNIDTVHLPSVEMSRQRDQPCRDRSSDGGVANLWPIE